MKFVTFEKAFKHGFEAVLLLLNYFLLLIPVFIVLISGDIDADTSLVTFLSVCLTAFGGLHGLYEKGELPMWLTSRRRAFLHNLALVTLFMAAILSFAAVLCISAILGWEYGTALICALALLIMALITPYILICLSISFQMFLLARNRVTFSRGALRDFIRPMLRKLQR